MNSDDLDFFALVADAGSISAAAMRAGCDPSTISRRITQLEQSLNARLFSRSGRGVKLTPQGEVLIDHARHVGAVIASARAALSTLSRQGPARVRIAAQPTIAKVLFGALFHAIRGRYPDTQIHFTEGLASQILAELQAGEIDIAILYKPAYPGSLEALAFHRVRRHLADEQDHRRGVLPGRVRAVGRVRGPRPARDEGDARPAGKLAVGVGHVRGGTFVPRDDGADVGRCGPAAHRAPAGSFRRGRSTRCRRRCAAAPPPGSGRRFAGISRSFFLKVWRVGGASASVDLHLKGASIAVARCFQVCAPRTADLSKGQTPAR
jgi:molybdenum-dependent DNA-binding transcriptional regulator ModE